MKTIRYAFWAIVGVGLVLVGLANTGMVTVRAIPEALAGLVGVSPDIQVPLFVVLFAGVAVGLLIGFLWEWVREHRIRADARAKNREVDALRREVAGLRANSSEGGDDVLALLESPNR